MTGRFIARGMTPEAAAEMAATTIAEAGGVALDVDMRNAGHLPHAQSITSGSSMSRTSTSAADCVPPWVCATTTTMCVVYNTSSSIFSQATSAGQQAAVTV